MIPTDVPVYVCACCGRAKTLDKFHKDSSRPSGRDPRCAECRSKRRRTGRPGGRPPKYASKSERIRNQGLKARYGITIEEYDAQLVRQGGVCAVCGGTDSKQRLHTDHDHETGKVRGLLCTRCNTALAVIENVELTEKLHGYLADPPWMGAATVTVGQLAGPQPRRC